MILEDRSVVVEDGQLRAGVDVEVVCRARVVEVVDHGRDQRSEDLQIRNPVLEERETHFYEIQGYLIHFGSSPNNALAFGQRVHL